MKLEFRENPQLPTGEIQVIVSSREKDADVDSLLDYLSQFGQEQGGIVTVRVEDRLRLLRVSDIVMAEVLRDHLTIRLVNATYTIRHRLSSFQEKLPQTNFVQVSRYAIVNVDYLSYLEDSFSGNMTAVLTTGDRTSISRRYLKELMKKLGVA